MSTERQILVAYSPGMGQTVGLTGQIEVGVNDESPPFISPGEMVNNTTGAITTPGNRTAAHSVSWPGRTPLSFRFTTAIAIARSDA